MKKSIVAMILSLMLVSSGSLWAAGQQQAVSENQPVSLTWLAGVWANQVDPDGYFTAAVKEALNIDLTVNIMPAAQLGQRAQVLIAGGDYPEILMLHGGPNAIYKQWAQQGLFVQLDSYWSRYPGLVNGFPEIETLAPARVDGKLFMVPVLLPSNRFGLVYRQDWLDAVGLAVPNTIEQFYQVLRAFTLGDPNRDGNPNTYGTGIDQSGGIGGGIVLNAFGVPGPVGAWHEQADGTVAPNFLHPRFPEALEFLRRIYAEELVDPDSVTKIFAEVNRDFDSGRIGVTIGQTWLDTSTEARLRQVFPQASLVQGPPIQDAAGNRIWNFFSAAWRGNVITQRADSEAKIDAALRLFDWMVTDGEEMTFFGPEGRYWTRRNAPGIPILEGEGLTAWGRSGDGYSEYQLMLRRFAPGPLVGSDVWSDQVAMDRYLANYELYEPHGYIDPTIGITTPTMTEIGPTLSDMIMSGFFEVVIADRPIEHFDSVVAEWRRRGGDRLIAEVNAAYRR